MRTLRSWLGILGTLATASVPTPAAAQPAGSEFQVNTYTTSDQLTVPYVGRSIAADASGNFVVVWHGYSQDGSWTGVFGQRYDSAGGALGNEFRVNSYTTQRQDDPSVAVDADGDFVVVWQSYGQDGTSWGVFGQRYDSGGRTLGSEFRVNSNTSSSEAAPVVGSDASGNFVVVWGGLDHDGSGWGIFGQRYDSQGGTVGSEFRVNSYRRGYQTSPFVASDESGNFVVVWQSLNQDGSSWGVFGQRYNSEGMAQGGEFRVNSYTTSAQRYPSAALDTSGNFVVVWEGSSQGDSLGILGQRYDSAGEAQGGEFQVNSFMTAQQRLPSVATDANGNVVVAWQSNGQDGSGDGIFGQRYDSQGETQGDEFQINSYTSNGQLFPTVGATGANQFVVAWTSIGQDGSGFGVLGQRFDFEGIPTIHVGDLDRKAKNVGVTWRAQVKTLVHDDGHEAVGGALVTLDVSGVGSRTCTTTANGICEVSVVVADSVPSLTFTVTSLSKAGFDYDAGANHDPDPDSNGTMIVVNQP